MILLTVIFLPQIIQLHRQSGCVSPNGPTYPTESQDEVDVLELQSELLVYLCPGLGQEQDHLRDIVTVGRQSSRNSSC